MSVECRICDSEVDPNYILENRFFREMYQDVICKWVDLTDRSLLSLCPICIADVKGFYKFKDVSRTNITRSKTSDDGEPGALPNVLQSLLDGCKESVDLSEEVLQVLDSDRSFDRAVRPKRECKRKTEEEKAMTPEEYRKYYHRKMWAKYKQVCPICGKSIIKKRMEGHMNGHKGLEPYSCPHCSMPFNCEINLKSHIRRVHTVQIPCEKCGKVINGQEQLRNHMREVHSGRTFSCHLCNSEFRRSSYLKNHLQARHSDQRDFSCLVCGKTFLRKFLLEVHMRTHTREEAYRCEICSEGFIHRRLYTLHMDKKHPGQPKMSKTDGQLLGKRTLMNKLYKVGD